MADDATRFVDPIAQKEKGDIEALVDHHEMYTLTPMGPPPSA